MDEVDLLIVGAGPAGMTAAIVARTFGLGVAVVDDQPAPGGQIWRSVEAAARRDGILGPSFIEGRAVAERFRACGAEYRPAAQIWRIEPGFVAYVNDGGSQRAIAAKAVVLATGAQERPVPFPGWTLPGVMTVGAAQILLKNAGQIPSGPVWIAGSGPLPLLYAIQLLRAGGQIAGYLDTTPSGQWRRALRYLPAALRSSGDLIKGLGWTTKLRASGIAHVSNVSDIEALGEGKIEQIQYRVANGKIHRASAETLLVHEGVVPSIHGPMSLGCEIAWNRAQDCFVPVLDEWGESSRPGLYVAGDGAGIGGAKAAVLRGHLVALRVVAQLGRAEEAELISAAAPVRAKLRRELAIRPFLDELFKPRRQVFSPPDATIACRCEEITARQIRAMAKIGHPGPNQIKSASRAGMGPCQGRQCGYTVTRLISEVQERAPADVGYFNVRPLLKPLSVGELASLYDPAIL